MEKIEAGDAAGAAPGPGQLTNEAVMQEPLIADMPGSIPEVKVRGTNTAGRTWAAMAVTAIVAGAAWFVTQSDGSRADVSPVHWLTSR
jgi:hypothetical protein